MSEKICENCDYYDREMCYLHKPSHVSIYDGCSDWKLDWKHKNIGVNMSKSERLKLDEAFEIVLNAIVSDEGHYKIFMEHLYKFLILEGKKRIVNDFSKQP